MNYDALRSWVYMIGRKKAMKRLEKSGYSKSTLEKMVAGCYPRKPKLYNMEQISKITGLTMEELSL